MQEYLSKGIKDIIAEFPGVGHILQEYGIGCGPCTVGICQLKDILEIHQISKNAEKELMLRIEAEIYPERNISLQSHPPALDEQASQDIPLSQALQTLVDEHKLIKRWVALMPVLAENLDLDSEIGRQVITTGIDFISAYADRQHHGKEEDILFTYFDDTADIFHVLYEDHQRARKLAGRMRHALEKRDGQELASSMLEYASLLEEHIHKEDTVLFPWLNTRLTEKQKDELVFRFKQADENLAVDSRNYLRFIEGLEQLKK